MWEKWVIDADSSGDGPVVFCPVELDAYGKIKSVVCGLMFIGPPRGEVIGVWHPDGPDAVQAWCEAHPNWRAEVIVTGSHI